MSLNCGIIGLPNVGKSTLFNALTRAQAAVANYPFCTLDPNVGRVPVPDERIARLSAIYRPKKETPTSIEIVDIAGLVEGASRGEGLGNQFLAHIREVDALIHIVRCFDDPDVIHVSGAVDPVRDIRLIDTELILKDLESVEARIARTQKKARSNDPAAQAEMALLSHLQDALAKGMPARSVSQSLENAPEAQTALKEMMLLTTKPVLYAANVPEASVVNGNAFSARVAEIALLEKTECIVVSGKIEAEIAALPAEEAEVFVREMGLSEPGLCRLVRAAYRRLDLITFFTVGEDEVKAWTIPNGTSAVQAAGEIHSDIQRGFIRAEIFRYDALIQHGSAQAIKEAGLLRLEGKEYRVQDGDCVYFRFNV